MYMVAPDSGKVEYLIEYEALPVSFFANDRYKGNFICGIPLEQTQSAFIHLELPLDVVVVDEPEESAFRLARLVAVDADVPVQTQIGLDVVVQVLVVGDACVVDVGHLPVGVDHCVLGKAVRSISEFKSDMGNLQFIVK